VAQITIPLSWDVVGRFRRSPDPAATGVADGTLLWCPLEYTIHMTAPAAEIHMLTLERKAGGKVIKRWAAG